MTEKLYYKDAYINEFSAEVISCLACDGGYDIVLDKTAFFPEEGGQYSDTGVISDAKITYVFEKAGIVHHIADKPLEAKSKCSCKINFEERFLKMQIHTAEHILSGLFHKLYGYDNVGFHLGLDAVTMDINAELTLDDITRVELMANEIVYQNVPVVAYFPSSDELSSLEYRSKLELSENVRIVKIGDYDSCACCAPHVSSTAEIGLIKVLDFMKHRGGTRLFITAGKAAYLDYVRKSESVSKISAMTSTPKDEIPAAVSKLQSDYESLKSEYKALRAVLFSEYAASVTPTDGNRVIYYENAAPEDLKTLANILVERMGGILVLLAGKDFDFKYLIVSKTQDLRSKIKDINLALNGRGGGKAEAVQGSFSSTLDEIKSYFEK